MLVAEEQLAGLQESRSFLGRDLKEITIRNFKRKEATQRPRTLDEQRVLERLGDIHMWR